MRDSRPIVLEISCMKLNLIGNLVVQLLAIGLLLVLCQSVSISLSLPPLPPFLSPSLPPSVMSVFYKLLLSTYSQ